MGWERLPPWTGDKHQGCIHAGPVEDVAPMDLMIGVGFGTAGVTRDGQFVWNENDLTVEDDWDAYWTVARAEKAAAADPDHDWRVVLEAPLRGQVYQRHEAGKWVLIESTMGFA